jgi:hypothetical protein
MSIPRPGAETLPTPNPRVHVQQQRAAGRLVNPVFDVNHPGEAGGLEPTARRFLDTRPSIVSTKGACTTEVGRVVASAARDERVQHLSGLYKRRAHELRIITSFPCQ